jgi:zinc finger FYVE domain-containing protein 26
VKPKVLEMLRAIKGTVTDEEWDKVVLCAVSVFVRELNDVKLGEKFVSRLAREDSRVDAYVLCGKLKSAYITAVKENLVDKVKMVREEARKDGQQTVVELCDKFLLQSPPKLN